MTSSNVIEGLSDKESYYVFKIDKNHFKLCETILDSFEPIKILELSSTGSDHEFSLVNPRINVIRNNNLVFGIGHSSLAGI